MKKIILLCSLLLSTHTLFAQVLLSEGFNVSTATTTLPTGWTVSSTGSTNACNGIDWMQVPNGGFICSVNGTPSPRPNAYSGSGMAGYNSWDIAANSISEMYSPSLNFSALGTYTLSFYVFQQNTMISNAHDTLKVYVNTSPSITGATLLYANDPNYNSSPAGWSQQIIPIPTTYTGTTNYIIFLGKSYWGQDIFIDEVEVTRTAPTPCSGTPLTPNITSATITTPLCLSSTASITAVDPNLPTIAGITYQWQSAPSSTGPWTNVTGGSGATTLNYTTAALTGSEWYRIGATCTTSSVTVYSAGYFVPTGAPQPGTITGPTTFCPGDPETYSVPNVSGTTYAWSLPSGWVGSSTTNSITVTPGTSAGAIQVTATTSCGTSVPQTRAVVFGSAPAAPGLIAGDSSICFNTTQTYSIAPVSGATSYTWSLPSGWTGTSTTNTITITCNTTSGNITVVAVNGCGQSTMATLPVTVITSLANPGTITGKDTVCSGAMETYSVAPVPGATSYTWSLPSGWSGTTTGTSVQVFAGSATGVISVTAYAACATSPASSETLTVITTVNPMVSISAPTGTLCQGTAITITASPTYPGTAPTYTWKKNGASVVAFGPSYTSYSFVKGDSVSVTMTSNADCASNTTVNSNTVYPNITPSVTPGVSINTVPPISICKGVSVLFTTVSNDQGTTPIYQWYKNGSMISGANGTTYTDATLNDGDTISIELKSNAACALNTTAMSNKVGVHVDDPVTPTVSISVSPSDVLTSGGVVTFTATNTNGGTTPDYQWQKNGVDVPFETGSSYTSGSLQAGDNITVTMLSYADCVTPGLVTSNIIVMKSALSVGTQGLVAGDIKIYPNPNSGRFTLAASSWDASLSGKQVRVDVLSAVGQSVYHMEFIPSAADWKTQVNLSAELANGQYMLGVSTEDGAVRTVLPFILSR